MDAKPVCVWKAPPPRLPAAPTPLARRGSRSQMLRDTTLVRSIIYVTSVAVQPAIPCGISWNNASSTRIGSCTLVLLRPPYAGANYTTSFSDNAKSSIFTQLFGNEAPIGAYKSYYRNLCALVLVCD